jgi:hypothetical protein
MAGRWEIQKKMRFKWENHLRNEGKSPASHVLVLFLCHALFNQKKAF